MPNPHPQPGYVALPVVQSGRTTYPKILGISAEGLEAIHHQSKTPVPLPWRELIAAGADMIDGSPEDFLEYLREIVNTTTSAPSGPTRRSTNGPRSRRRRPNNN